MATTRAGTRSGTRAQSRTRTRTHMRSHRPHSHSDTHVSSPFHLPPRLQLRTRTHHTPSLFVHIRVPEARLILDGIVVRLVLHDSLQRKAEDALDGIAHLQVALAVGGS